MTRSCSLQQNAEGLADAVVSFARLDHAVNQSGQNLADQFKPPAGELDRILALVETIDAWIGLQRAGVLIGGESQRRLVAARGELAQHGHFAFGAAGQRLVPVFNRPVVVGTDAFA